MLKSFVETRPSRDAIKILVLLLIGCSFLSIIIPPFQSPDEHDHIKRAYLLSKGVLVLEHPVGKASGGYIDSGLLAFMDSYGVNRGLLPKLSAEDIASADAIQWSNQHIYSPAPGTGYYFPVIYLPQGLGLWLGETLNLSIDHSYRLARAGALITVALLLYAAFVLHPPSPLLLALIAIPMTLFQISSASLDGVSTALTIFSISVFLRIASDQRSSANWLQYSLALAITILATSRIHALPILALLAAAFLYTRSRKSLILLAIACLLISGWTLFALKTTVDLRVPLGDSKHNIAIFYLQHPPQFFQVVWQTLSDHNLQIDYFRSFFGILGWRDIQFKDWHYAFFAASTAFITLLTASFARIAKEWPQRLLLLAISVTSVFFIFFPLLVTWTHHPAHVISGVQGRYFLLPAIILAYGITGNTGVSGSLRQNLATFATFCLFIFSIHVTATSLIKRYYLNEFGMEVENIIYWTDDPDGQAGMMPSMPLGDAAPITLKLPATDTDSAGRISRIGILFGTYMRNNPGEAELVLVTKDSNVHRQRFTLADLIDNSYRYFKLPPDDYASGEIRYLSGSGVSVWESTYSNGDRLSCLKLMTTRNQVISIGGCP